MELLLSTRPGRDCTVIEVAGELDLATEPQLRDALERAIDAGSRQVVVDLRRVRFIDSTAVGMLIVIFKRLRDAGGRLCLAAAQEPVRRVLALTSVDRAIEVYDTVPAAEASVPPAAA